jgi:hypothetical protein
MYNIQSKSFYKKTDPKYFCIIAMFEIFATLRNKYNSQTTQACQALEGFKAKGISALFSTI